MIQPGSKVGHYEIASALGKGGMGEVWRARDTKLGREVAIKTLPDAFSKDVDRLARFEREARMLAALNHSNIAAIYGLEEDEGVRFLVLELVEGETLAERLHRGPLSIEESLNLGLQISEALESAHDKGVIHRDLKPANIKVTPHGGVKVLDFGLAKAFAGDLDEQNPSNSPTLSMQATAQGMILGTAAYMAPEQAKAQPVDKRADVWAFGCVLYEMLTGRPVFAGPDVSTILARVLDRDPDFGALPSNLDPRISDLIARALEKDPASRWHDIADLGVTLQRVLADPDRGRIDPVAASPGGSARANRAWIAAAVLAAIAASIGTWFLKPGAIPGPVVRSVISVRENPPLQLPFRAIAITPDGSGVVYAAPGPDGASLYLRRMDELEGGSIRGPVNAVDPVFSPDGSSIAFASGASGALERVSILGGPTTNLYELDSEPYGATWGPDDTIISAGRFSPGLSRIPEVGGERETLTDAASDGPHFWPEYLPEGNAVLFTIVRGTGSANHQVAVLDLESNEQTVLIAGASHARYAESGHVVYAIDDTLWAVGFDPKRLEVLTDPVPVVEGVATTPANGVSQFDIASNGSLVYITQVGPLDASTGGAPPTRLTIFDADGNTRMLDAGPRPYRNPRISPNGDQVAVEIIDGDQSSIWIYNLAGGSAIRRLTQVSEGNNTRPLWTPDGGRIAFASDRDGPQSIYWQPCPLKPILCSALRLKRTFSLRASVSFRTTAITTRFPTAPASSC